MGYSNDHHSGAMEPNSISLAMFASVGFHAVLFVLMAFFPAASETVKKPLRIVNLLPPSQPSSNSLQSQAKTSTLEDILQNPLPDLSAGSPPLGNTDASALEAAPDTSSYLGGNSSYNNRVDTSNLTTTDPPTRSFTPSPTPSTSSTNQSQTNNPPSQSPSKITPAPSNPGGQFSPSPSGGTLSEPPSLIGAAPPPTEIPPLFPDDSQGNLNPASAPPRQIPPSKQNIIPIISTNVPYQYPASACPNALQGTATLTYYRKPDGSYVDGSGVFENKSDSSILNTAALNAVISSTAPGTGDYQRYSSRFDFVYSKDICAGVTANSPEPPSLTSPSVETPASKTDGESGDASELTPSKDESKQSPKPSGEIPTPPPSKSKTKENSKPSQSNPGASQSPRPQIKEEKPNTVTPSPKPKQPLSDQVPQGGAAEPGSSPVTPKLDERSPSPTPSSSKPQTPLSPPPTPPTSTPRPEPSITPEGSAADLTPITPVTPKPTPIKPSDSDQAPAQNPNPE